MTLRAAFTVAILVAGSASSACRSTPSEPAATVALRAVLDRQAQATDSVSAATRAFYAQREGTPAWVNDKGKVKQRDAILGVIDEAAAHGLAVADYARDELASAITAAETLDGSAEQRAPAVAELDARLTTALLTLGHDVALGRTSPAAIDARWKAARTAPDFAGTLASLSDGKVSDWLDRVRPNHQEYVQLQQALQALVGQRDKGGWPAINAKTLSPGQRQPAVATLRQRLVASGELKSGDASPSPVYDDTVAAAVKAFQEHHTLKANGIADAATIAAMNVPVDARIAQVQVNLERWRWMPDDFGARYLLVNIPSYHVIAREDGKDVMDIRVVVGKEGHETPVFSGDMQTVVFSPYWNIPDTIAEGETVPAMMRDSKYLDRNNIEVMRVSKTGPEHVDPNDVDWDDEGVLKALSFRQKPGPDNALGRVKFLFPNQYDVYLHDTPADALFSRTGRAFSHGCVRVEEPEALAKYVLRGDTSWDEPKILDAMNAGTEQHVKLATTIPVHIVYFTATVDANGGIHLLNDVYGYDTKQLAAGKRAAVAMSKK